jgi:lipopolysaccharide transport system permease protein
MIPDQEGSVTQAEEQLHEEFFGHAHVTEISAKGQGLRAELREVWAYRDLLALLVRRDISVRYKQSAVGFGWILLQPLAMMVVFSIIFGRFARLPSDGIPYPLFAMSALLPWLYFSKALVGSSDSLVSASHMIKKVYFPRLVIPLSRTLSGLVDFVITFLVLGVMLLWYGFMPGWQVVFLPLIVLTAIMTALGLGLWLTALNVKYRDVGLIVPFLVQIWMYASPIAYSSSIVPERWRWLYDLNPMVGVIDGFRWALLGKEMPRLDPLFTSFGLASLILVGGLAYFRRMERSFADVI